MLDMANAQARELVRRFEERLNALLEVFQIEATALGWQIAAQELAAMLPSTFALGTLDWRGRAQKNKVTMAMPAPKKLTSGARFALPEPKAEAKTRTIKGKGKVKINSPKPNKRADEYTELLSRKEGTWMRRANRKMTYTCVGWRSVPEGAHPVFYLMKNHKTGKTITVKFESIVRDWTYTKNAVNDEVLRPAA